MVTENGRDNEMEFVEVESIKPIIDNMSRILFKPQTLTHDDRRDLENLLALLQNRIKGE